MLQAATSVPAEWLQMRSGRISVGYEADLVLLNGNPLLDIANTREINTVILGGKVLDRVLLDEILIAVKEANDASRSIDIKEYIKGSIRTVHRHED